MEIVKQAWWEGDVKSQLHHSDYVLTSIYHYNNLMDWIDNPWPCTVDVLDIVLCFCHDLDGHPHRYHDVFDVSCRRNVGCCYFHLDGGDLKDDRLACLN